MTLETSHKLIALASNIRTSNPPYSALINDALQQTAKLTIAAAGYANEENIGQLVDPLANSARVYGHLFAAESDYAPYILSVGQAAMATYNRFMRLEPFIADMCASTLGDVGHLLIVSSDRLANSVEQERTRVNKRLYGVIATGVANIQMGKKEDFYIQHNDLINFDHMGAHAANRFM